MVIALLAFGKAFFLNIYSSQSAGTPISIGNTSLNDVRITKIAIGTAPDYWVDPVAYLNANMDNTEDSGAVGFVVPVTHQTTVPAGYTGIYTAQDLDNVRNSSATNFILMNDIDLAGMDWLPITRANTGVGLPGGIVQGAFDGNGYLIMNMKVYINEVDSPGNSTIYGGGLFGTFYRNSTIKNIGIVNANVEVLISKSNANVKVGGIVGYISGGSIENCFFSGGITVKSLNQNASGAAYIGGIVGEPSGTTVIDCANFGIVQSSAASLFGLDLGGIVGFNTSSSGEIYNCRNEGAIVVSSFGSSYVGGIVGHSNLQGTHINNCVNLADIDFVNDSDGCFGGILGRGIAGGVSSCFNTGNINVSTRYSSYSGGIIGESSATNCYNKGLVTSNRGAGGVVGIGSSSTCYNSGLVNGEPVGGVAGRCFTGIIENCYYLNSLASTAIGSKSLSA